MPDTKLNNNQTPIEYTYVTNGKRTSTILKTQKIGEDLYNYHYDALNNITRIYKNNNLEHRYYYDDYNELIKEKDYNANETISYTYDESGNLLSKKVYDLSTNTLKDQNTYEYSNQNWEDQLTKFNNETITYDEIGNPLTIGNKTLTWENGRQLKEIKDQTNTIEYQYDNGIRTSKTVNNQKTDYYLEGNKIILEKREEDMLYYIRNEVDDLIGFEYQNQMYYYVKNIQNDIIGILDQNGNKVVTYTYDSWGNILSIIDSNNNDVSEDLTHIANINPFRYRSYYYDVETKLYYLNSRYYNPLWGRFLNADGVIEINQSSNLYLYCNNNPISLYDPSGNLGLFATCVAVFVAASMIAKAVISVAKQKAKKKKISAKKVAQDVVKGINIEVGAGFGHSISATANMGSVSVEPGIGAYKDFSIGLSNGEIYQATVTEVGATVKFSNYEFGFSSSYEHKLHEVTLDSIQHDNMFAMWWDIENCDHTQFHKTVFFTQKKNDMGFQAEDDGIFAGFSFEQHRGLGIHIKIGYNF